MKAKVPSGSGTQRHLLWLLAPANRSASWRLAVYPTAYSLTPDPCLLCFSNQARRYSWVLRKFEGVLLVPCHSFLNRTMADGTFRNASAW